MKFLNRKIPIIRFTMFLMLLIFFFVILHITIYVLFRGERRKIDEDYDEKELMKLNNIGNNEVLSDLKINEYVCSGSCYCGDSVERRSLSHLMNAKKLSVLITAVSSLFAYRNAKNRIRIECEEELSQICPRDYGASIMSEIDDCENVKFVDFKKKVKISKGEHGKLKEREEHRAFVCSGQCFAKDYSKICKDDVHGYQNLHVLKLQSLSDEYCSSISNEDVNIEFTTEEIKRKYNVDITKHETEEELLLVARRYFIDEYMLHYCAYQSQLFDFLRRPNSPWDKNKKKKDREGFYKAFQNAMDHIKHEIADVHETDEEGQSFKSFSLNAYLYFTTVCVGDEDSVMFKAISGDNVDPFVHANVKKEAKKKIIEEDMKHVSCRQIPADEAPLWKMEIRALSDFDMDER